MEPNTWRGRDTFSKILSLPICASCMPNVLGFRRVLQHPRKVYFPTVRDSNVWDGKLHEIVNDKSQRVISSVYIKLNKIFQRTVESVKDVLSENWQILEKILSFFCSLSTFNFLRFLFVFVICIWLVMWYFFICSQLKELNIRINDLKMHFSILLQFQSDEPIQL